jgi:hypothetical protein
MVACARVVWRSAAPCAIHGPSACAGRSLAGQQRGPRRRGPGRRGDGRAVKRARRVGKGVHECQSAGPSANPQQSEGGGAARGAAGRGAPLWEAPQAMPLGVQRTGRSVKCCPREACGGPGLAEAKCSWWVWRRRGRASARWGAAALGPPPRRVGTPARAVKQHICKCWGARWREPPKNRPGKVGVCLCRGMGTGMGAHRGGGAMRWRAARHPPPRRAPAIGPQCPSGKEALGRAWGISFCFLAGAVVMIRIDTIAVKQAPAAAGWRGRRLGMRRQCGRRRGGLRRARNAGAAGRGPAGGGDRRSRVGTGCGRTGGSS